MNPKIARWISNLDPDFQDTATVLYSTVMNAHPGMQDLWKYGVPYFECNGVICFFNKKKEAIDVGFMKGFLMPAQMPMVEDRGLKRVRHIVIPSKPSIEHIDALTMMLNEAIMLNIK